MAMHEGRLQIEDERPCVYVGLVEKYEIEQTPKQWTLRYKEGQQTRESHTRFN